MALTRRAKALRHRAIPAGLEPCPRSVSTWRRASACGPDSLNVAQGFSPAADFLNVAQGFSPAADFLNVAQGFSPAAEYLLQDGHAIAPTGETT